MMRMRNSVRAVEKRYNLSYDRKESNDIAGNEIGLSEKVEENGYA